jgi:branched-chain amino acid transport system ATP-binding protein
VGTAADTLLTVEGLSVYYGPLRAVHDVSIRVGSGEIVSVIGANGAGKSSLLKAIIGQAERCEGRIVLNGAEIGGKGTPSIIRDGVVLVPEGRRLFPNLTIEENLRLGWRVGRRGGPTLADVYDLFPVLKERQNAPARVLSGGQQQMVALGRALLADPRILLCDEISLGLAPTVIADLYALLPTIRDRGIGVLLVEQDISRSLRAATRFYCMLEGRISLSGSPGAFDRETITRSYFGS